MGDLGLEGRLATAASPPSTSLLENVGNVGVPKKRDNHNEIRPVKIPNWTASPAAIEQPRRRKPRWDVIRVCRTEPRRGANPHPRDVAVSPPVHHSHDLHRVTGGRNAARAAGIEARLTAHSGRVGLASELTARGASTTEVMLAGNWKTARMVAHYSAGAAAEKGAVAKYL